MDRPPTELITRPDANPLLMGLANLFGMGGLGYWWMGQRQKAFVTWGVVIVGGFCTFGMLWIVVFITAYDAYLLGQRLAQGEALRETDNGVPLLDLIFK